MEDAVNTKVEMLSKEESYIKMIMLNQVFNMNVSEISRKLKLLG